jgi:TctA family transporter
MLMSKGSMGIFFSNWLVATLVTLGVVLLVLPFVMQLMGKRSRKPALAE